MRECVQYMHPSDIHYFCSIGTIITLVFVRDISYYLFDIANTSGGSFAHNLTHFCQWRRSLLSENVGAIA